MWTNDTIDKFNAPGDVAGMKATGYREGGVNDTTHQRSAGSAQPGNALVNNENIPSAARGTETAQSGQFIGGVSDGQGIRREQPTQANGALVNNENITEARGHRNRSAGTVHEWWRWRRDGHPQAPRPNNRPRKGKRMHKP